MAEIAISLAISAAVSAASAGLQYALTPKPKKPAPVDRGKLDDVRFSLPAYGAAIPKGWGTFRVAPIWFWHTEAIDIPVTTPGQQGGKGGGGAPPTPDTIEHRYFKNLAGVFHDGLVNKGVARIWFDNEPVYNASLARGMADTSSTRYEAEHGVLAGGASVATQTECSGGKKVTGLGSGGTVTIHCDVAADGTYEVSIGYTSTVQRTFKVSVNGGTSEDLVCAASGGAGIVAYQTISLVLTSGANTILFANSGAAAPDLDSISIAPALAFEGGLDTRSFTGLITPGRVAPTDQDIAWPVSDEIPEFSDTAGGVTAGGFFSATLGKWGNPQIRIYPGSEEQPQDPLIVSVMGADNTPAYRGFAYLVIEGLQLQNGRVPNVTIELEQGTREAAIIVSDVYAEVGIPATDLDVSALGGLVLGDSTGFEPGTYSAITWTGLNNATQSAGGKINKTSGTQNTWNAYAHNGSTVSAGTDAAIRFTAGIGTFMVGFATTTTPGSSLPNPYAQVPFAVLLNLNSNPSQDTRNAIQMSLGGSNNSSDVGVWAVGDKFQVEYRNGRFAAYQNGLLLSGFTPPVPSGFPLIPIVVMYATGGGPEAASYATGANIGSEAIVANGGALILDTQREAGELLEELMTRFQFLLPEVDGKIKAVMLNASSDLTLTHDEIRAYRGDTPAEVGIDRANPLTFPKKTIVNYLDPQMDYHANAQVEPRLYGPQKGTLNVTLAMVETADNMKKLAITLSDRAEVEGQRYRFSTGAKYKRIHQGTVVTLMLPNSTDVVRVTEIRADLPAGLIEFEAVKQSVAFSPNAVGSVGAGVENPVVAVPGNTIGVVLDGPLLRTEDAGDGTQPVVYVAMCGRGSGNWPAGMMHREFPANSDNYILETTSTTPSGIGVSSGTLPSVSDPTLWDRSSSLVVGFYSNTELSSATEEDLLANPELNLIAVANPTTGEVELVQFKTAIPLTIFPLNPLDAPGFIGYWEADGLTPGTLSSWPSLGGGPTMSGGTAPTVIADALNGKNVVEFAATKYLTFTEITTIRTVYLVVKHDQTTAANRDRFMPILGHSTLTNWIGMEGTRLVGAAHANVTGGSAYLNGYPMSVATLSKAGEYEVFAFVTTGNTSANQFANDRSAHWFAGRVAAIAMFNQPHSQQTVSKVTEYFVQDRALSLPSLIVTDGDSITADRPGSGNGLLAGNAWPDQMIPMLNATAFGNYDTYNVAVGGQSLANMNTDAATEVDPLLNTERAQNICVVWAGTNDMGIPGSASGATTYSRLVTYCQARQAAGWVVLVMVCLKRNDLSNFPNQAALDAFEVQRGIYNTNIRSNWATFADALVDLETYDFFNNTTGASGADSNMDLTDPNNTIFFNADKIHLNALGQTVVATAVKETIEGL